MNLKRALFLSISSFFVVSIFAFSFEQRITLPKNLIYKDSQLVDAVTNRKVILDHTNVAIVWDFDETLALHDEDEYGRFCEKYKKELGVIVKVMNNVTPPLHDDEKHMFDVVEKALKLPTLTERILFYRSQGLNNFAQCMTDIYCVRNPMHRIHDIITWLVDRGHSNFLATNQGPLLVDAIRYKPAFKEIFSNITAGLVSSRNGMVYQDALFKTSFFRKPMREYYDDFQKLVDPSKRYKYYILIDNSVSNFKVFPEMDNFIGIKFEDAQNLLQDLRVIFNQPN